MRTPSRSAAAGEKYAIASTLPAIKRPLLCSAYPARLCVCMHTCARLCALCARGRRQVHPPGRGHEQRQRRTRCVITTHVIMTCCKTAPQRAKGCTRTRGSPGGMDPAYPCTLPTPERECTVFGCLEACRGGGHHLTHTSAISNAYRRGRHRGWHAADEWAGELHDLPQHHGPLAGYRVA